MTYSRDGSGAEGADVGVVVIGETPYAEGRGDRSDLSLAAEDVAAVRAVHGARVPTVVVLVSGRPLILDTILGDADVLFGDVAPTGKLSHSWPRSLAQVPVNWGDTTYDPLYPYGYRLSY